MARYRFKIIDRKTTLAKMGTLDAPSTEKARQHLEQKGFLVEWLQPAGAPIPEDLGAPGLDPPPRRKQGRRGRADHWQRLSLSDQTFKILLATGATLGLLLLPSRSGGDAVAAPASKLVGQSLTKQSVAFTGKLARRDGQPLSPRDVTVTLRLPQIPYSQSWQGDEVVGSDLRLAQSVEFQTRRLAGYAEILFDKPGFSTTQKKQLLTSKDASIDLGSVILEPLVD